MKHIIFFPGLGTDERLFRFVDLGNCRKHFIKWVKPVRDETLHSYLLKLKEQIPIEEPPVLVGVSLGGIAAMGFRELIPVEKTIIISSVKTRGEMPGVFNLVHRSGLNRMVPLWLLKRLALFGPVITGNRSPNSTALLEQMIHDADEDFFYWGMQAALDWKRSAYDKNNLVHIHGTRDLVFPLRNINHCDYIIKDGTHGMIMSRPREINEILRREIFLS